MVKKSGKLDDINKGTFNLVKKEYAFRMKKSLSIKIFILCLVSLLIPVIINNTVAVKSSENALETEMIDSLSRLVNEKKKEVDLVFDSQFRLSEAWVNELFVVDFMKEISEGASIDESKLAYIEKSLTDRFKKADGLYENIFFTYDDKVLVDGIGGQSLGLAMDKEREAYYYEQLKNPGAATGDYMYSPVTGRPTLPIINSVIDSETKKVLSTLVIPIDVNKLTENLVQDDNKNNDEKIATMILDPTGLVIASDKEGLTLELNFSEHDEVKPFYEEIKNKDKGFGRFTLDGVEYVASYVKHDTHEFYILSYVPVSKYMEKIDALKLGAFNVLIASIIVFGIIIFFVVRSLVKPIKIVAQNADQIAKGDLTAEEIRIKSKDEVGRLAASFNQMLSSLQAMVKQVSVTSKKVSDSAEELSATAEQSSEISRQVADSIKQVSAGMDEQSLNTSYSSEMLKEVAEGVKQVSENAQSVASAANLATEKAQAGGTTIHSSIAEIQSVNENIHQMAEKIKRLGERSKEIEQIVTVITQIAEQTNLLALNAAIEAARAGEQGRGFAVVADEVRKLAEQSKESSEQIQELINRILTETEEAVLSIDETVDQSTKGISAIQSVNQVFDDIQQSILEVTGQVQEVSSATQQMSAAVNQIASNINEITRIASDTASQTQEVATAMEDQLTSSEQIASSSTEMAELADELKQLVQKFKVK